MPVLLGFNRPDEARWLRAETSERTSALAKEGGEMAYRSRKQDQYQQMMQRIDDSWKYPNRPVNRTIPEPQGPCLKCEWNSRGDRGICEPCSDKMDPAEWTEWNSRWVEYRDTRGQWDFNRGQYTGKIEAPDLCRKLFNSLMAALPELIEAPDQNE